MSSGRMNVQGAAGVEDRKMKSTLEEVHDVKEEHFLSLRLCNNADMSKPLVVAPPPPPPPLPKPSTAGSSSSSAGTNKRPEGGSSIRMRTTKEFRCKYCRKKFKSSQALGGHQNAHRRERVLSKMRELGHGHLCPCPSIAAAASSSPTSFMNPHHHFHRHNSLISPNSWALHHHPQPRPEGFLSSIGMTMMMNSLGNPNVVQDKKLTDDDASSSSGLDLSLRL